MTPDDYTRLSQRTAPPLTREDAFVLAALGLMREAAEAAEHIEREQYFATPLDADALALELGDVLWYLTYMATTAGLTLETVMERNVAKLAARYPSGYSAAAYAAAKPSTP